MLNDSAEKWFAIYIIIGSILLLVACAIGV